VIDDVKIPYSLRKYCALEVNILSFKMGSVFVTGTISAANEILCQARVRKLTIGQIACNISFLSSPK
jgi:hypothetical protein